MANREDPGQTAPFVAVLSGYPLFAKVHLSEYLAISFIQYFTEVKNSNDSGIEKEPPSEERKEEKMDEDDDELDLTEDKGEKEDTTEDKQVI